MSYKKSSLKNGYLIMNPYVNYIIGIIDTVGYFLFKFRRKQDKPKKIDNILLVMFGSFGDGLLFTTVLKSIRENFPKSRIDVLCNKEISIILKNNLHIDNILISPIGWGYKYPGSSFKTCNIKHWGRFDQGYRYMVSLFKIIKILKHNNVEYDVALCFRASFDNGILPVFLSGTVGYIIGYKTGSGGFLLDKIVEWQSGIHETQHFLKVIQEICPPCELNECELFYDFEETIKELKQIFSQIGISPKDKLVVIHPTSKEMRKSLTVEQTRNIIKKILNKTTYKILITGMLQDLPFFGQLKLNDYRLIGLHGKLDIFQLYELLKTAEVVFTVDTFISHLAALSKTKTVVFWSGITDVREWGPTGGNVEVISLEEVACKKWQDCHRWCKERSCMDFDLENANIDEIIYNYL